VRNQFSRRKNWGPGGSNGPWVCGVLVVLGGSIGGAWGPLGGPRPATLSTCDFNDLNGAVYFDFMELVDC
jgi:hypothetical protein